MSNYNINCKAINQIFKDKFFSSYRELRKRKKTHIFKYLSSVYRRWFYSALIEDTSLTPANLFAMLDVGEETDQTPAFRTPVVRPISNIRDALEFQIMTYSEQNHPVINDLRLFIESCQPDVALNENDMLFDAHVESLMEQLSLCDSFYVEYLLNTSIMLGFLKKSPSIYANRARVTDIYEETMRLPSEEMFRKVVEVSITAAAAFITEMIPLPEPYFTVDVIKSLLKSPMALDDIFQEVYNLIGVRLEDLSELENFEDMDDDPFSDDINSAVISSTFLLGLLLDKCFLTPFGYYLKLIRPLYTLPYEFENELNYLVDSFGDEEGPITALYAPSTYYQLTPLGKIIFGVTDSGKAVSQESLPFDSLMNLVEGKVRNPDDLMALIKEEFASTAGASIYTIKTRLQNAKSLWKNIEIPSILTLHQLFLEICYHFALDANAEYSFFGDVTETPFNEYASRQSARRAKKANDFTLLGMNWTARHKFVLVLYNTYNPYASYEPHPTKKLKFELEITRITPREEGLEYPRIGRMSSAFRELEN